MENISQKRPPKRGRPRAASDTMWKLVTQMEGSHTSHRHRANFLYGVRATEVLGEDARFAWLRQARRSVIMDELGRIAFDADLRTMAQYLCDHHPSTRQALAWIRAFRLGTRPPGTAAELCAVVCRAIDTYAAEHRDLSHAMVGEALAQVTQRYQSPWRPPQPQLPPATDPLQAFVEFLRQHCSP